MISLVLAMLASQAQVVWNPGTGLYAWDGGAPLQSTQGVLYPYMTPAGPLAPGPAFANIANANPLTIYSAPMYSMAQVGDFDSLVPSTVANRKWWQTGGPSNCAFIPLFAQTTDGGAYVLNGTSPYGNGQFISAVEMNPGGFVGERVFWTGISAPQGTTFWTLTANIQKGYAGTNGVVPIGFIDNGCVGSYSVFTDVTPTPAMAAYSVTTAPSQGVVYVAAIAINGFSGGTPTGDPVIGNVQLKPAGATGVFAGDFWRIGADPKLLWYNYLDSPAYQASGNTIFQSPGTAMVVDTDATQMNLEIHDTNLSGGNEIGVWVNGQPYLTITSAASNFPEYHNFTLPSGMKKVEVGNGRNNFTAQTFGTYGQVEIRAIYVPASSTTWVEPEPVAKERIIVYSDSMAWSDSTFNEPQISLVGVLRRIFPGSVYSEVIGGRQLYLDVTNETSAPYWPNIQTMVDYWAKIGPTHIWLAQMYNDWADNNWLAANFGIAYGQFMDALHARMPEAKIFMQTLTITNHEAATNTNGETLPNFRTAETNACNARPWCTLVVGTSSPPFQTLSDLLSDGIHPTPEGMQTWANAIVTTVDSPGASGAAPLSWTPRGGQCTLSTGACTVADTSILSTSEIVVTPVGAGATVPCYVTVTAGTSFTITCTGAGSDVANWIRMN